MCTAPTSAPGRDPGRVLVAAGQVRQDRGWRPGGYNLLAVNRANKRLYVGMHPNGAEGTHKTPAAEIWSTT